jgi:hypothetical protein
VDLAGNEHKAVTSVSATPTKKPIIDDTPPPPITGLIATDARKVDLAWIPDKVEDFNYYAIYLSEKEIRDSPVSRRLPKSPT